MCLFPGGGGATALAVQSGSEIDKQRKMMVFVTIGHGVFGLLNLISGNLMDGLFDLMGAGIGYWGIREEERIQPTMVLCYLVFVIMDCFWAILTSMLLLADVKQIEGPVWRRSLFCGLTYASVIFYAVAIYVSYKLYKLLQREWDATMGGLEAGNPYNGGGGGAIGNFRNGGLRAPGDGGSGGFPAPGIVNRGFARLGGGSSASGAASGFKGQGYRLGDGKRVGGR
eukprot:jgi/Bigna1/88765/estExt_fgenesh1_pg.C_370152